jgi:hypothetical protein
MPFAPKRNTVKQHSDDKADAQQDDDQQSSRYRKTPYQELYFNRGNVLNRKDQHRDDQQQTDNFLDATHGSLRDRHIREHYIEQIAVEHNTDAVCFQLRL